MCVGMWVCETEILMGHRLRALPQAWTDELAMGQTPAGAHTETPVAGSLFITLFISGGNIIGEK